MRKRNKGFTLLECILALGLATVIGTASMMILIQIQKNVREISSSVERDENLRLSPLVLLQLVQAAGCAQSEGWQGIEAEAGILTIRSDIDGPEGFPDQTLNQSYEILKLRFTGTDLQFKSGVGSYQPLFRLIEDFEFSYSGGTELEIEVKGQKNSIFNIQETRSLPFRFFLWNYSRNLFERN